MHVLTKNMSDVNKDDQQFTNVNNNTNNINRMTVQDKTSVSQNIYLLYELH